MAFGVEICHVDGNVIIENGRAPCKTADIPSDIGAPVSHIVHTSQEEC